jgi:hypothetical protein
MRILQRFVMATLGAILLLPGACSARFTPLFVRSASGRDPLGIDARPWEMFFVFLYFVPIGYAIALGGGWLIKCAYSNASPMAPRWLMATAGILLLMPGISVAALFAEGDVARTLGPRNPQAAFNLSIVLLGPVLAAAGAFLLWRAKARPRKSAG